MSNKHEHLDREQITKLIDEKNTEYSNSPKEPSIIGFILGLVFLTFMGVMIGIGVMTSLDYVCPKIQEYCNDSERIDCLEVGEHQWGESIEYNESYNHHILKQWTFHCKHCYHIEIVTEDTMTDSMKKQFKHVNGVEFDRTVELTTYNIPPNSAAKDVEILRIDEIIIEGKGIIWDPNFDPNVAHHQTLTYQITD